jgi:ferrous iron transport protein A
MSTSASSFPTPLIETPDPGGGPRARTLGREREASGTREISLDAIATGGHATIEAVVLDADQAAWLSAVGIREGERLTVLRRASFGGPMHVRTRAGGEFAIARSLARAILVRRNDAP